MQRDNHHARQQAELASAEAKALSQEQVEAMDDTGSHLDAVDFPAKPQEQPAKASLGAGLRSLLAGGLA